MLILICNFQVSALFYIACKAINSRCHSTKENQYRINILLLPVVSMNIGWVSLIALYTVFLLMSIMFPTIFALGIKDLGPQTKKGASIIVMAVVGGAVFPPFMGHISDLYSMSVGFLAPIPLFMFILYYAVKGHHVRP